MPNVKGVGAGKKVVVRARKETPAVSNLRAANAFPVAVVCSDLHLSHTAPRNRAEKGVDWYRVMDQSLDVVTNRATQLGVPLIIAGDIFHTWDNPAELVNFTIQRLSKARYKVYAIPGQHDLPNHNYEDVVKSSYWTLIESNVIEDMEPGYAYTYTPETNEANNPVTVRLWPFPWGCAPHHPEKFDKDWDSESPNLHVAVIHRYVWGNQDTGYPGAPEDQNVRAYALDPFNVSVFGDNHIGFSSIYQLLTRGGYPGRLFNCGAFMRRNIDQKDYQIRYGLIMSDGTVIANSYRPTYDDKWTEQSVVQSLKEIANATSPLARSEAVQAFIAEAGEMLVDFKDVVWKFIQTGKLPAEVRKILEEVTNVKP